MISMASAGFILTMSCFQEAPLVLVPSTVEGAFYHDLTVLGGKG